MRFFLGARRSSKRQSLPEDMDRDTPCVISITNETRMPLQLYLDDNGPVLTVGGREKTVTKKLPPMQLQGVRCWAAIAIVHGQPCTVQKGAVSNEMRKQCRIHILPSAFEEAILGMSTGSYLRIVEAQQMWRRRLQALAAARAFRRRLAAKRIKREVQAHLHRSPRTCFVCLETVRWDSMVTLVPDKKCHRICTGCTSRHIDVALSEGRMHVRCAGEGCKHQMSKATIQQYGSADALSQWGQNQQAANARRAAGLASEESAFLVFCTQHTRICPGCHVIIYRHAGCNHMTCMCGFEFDWETETAAKIGSDGRVIATQTTATMSTGDTESSAQPARASAGAPRVHLRPPRRARGRLPDPRPLGPQTAAEEEAQLAAAIAESIEIHARDGEQGA